MYIMPVLVITQLMVTHVLAMELVIRHMLPLLDLALVTRVVIIKLGPIVYVIFRSIYSLVRVMYILHQEVQLIVPYLGILALVTEHVMAREGILPMLVVLIKLFNSVIAIVQHMDIRVHAIIRVMFKSPALAMPLAICIIMLRR